MYRRGELPGAGAPGTQVNPSRGLSPTALGTRSVRRPNTESTAGLYSGVVPEWLKSSRKPYSNCSRSGFTRDSPCSQSALVVDVVDRSTEESVRLYDVGWLAARSSRL